MKEHGNDIQLLKKLLILESPVVKLGSKISSTISQHKVYCYIRVPLVSNKEL